MKSIYAQLATRVDEVLCYIWDPIGVSSEGTPETRDEYSSYVPEICSAVSRGETKEQIANRLEYIERVTMGLETGAEGSMQRRLEVAMIILDWYEFLQDNLTHVD